MAVVTKKIRLYLFMLQVRHLPFLALLLPETHSFERRADGAASAHYGRPPPYLQAPPRARERASSACLPYQGKGD